MKIVGKIPYKNRCLRFSGISGWVHVLILLSSKFIVLKEEFSLNKSSHHHQLFVSQVLFAHEWSSSNPMRLHNISQTILHQYEINLQLSNWGWWPFHCQCSWNCWAPWWWLPWQQSPHQPYGCHARAETSGGWDPNSSLHVHGELRVEVTATEQ